MNFTNLGGVGGKIYFLKNVNGMWLLSQCLDELKRLGIARPLLPDLLAECAALEALTAPLDAAGWRMRTRFYGWAIYDEIAHLCLFDEIAVLAAENRERFRAELEARMRQWSAALAPYAGAKLIAYHNTWPYFARRFRLDIVDLVEPKAGVSPSPPTHH